MDDARTRLRVRCCAPSRNTPGRSQPAPFGPSSGARSDRRGRRSAPREDACALRKVMNRSGLEPALGGQRGQQAHWTVGITATPFVESSLFLADLRTGHELNVERLALRGGSVPTPPASRAFPPGPFMGSRAEVPRPPRATTIIFRFAKSGAHHCESRASEKKKLRELAQSRGRERTALQ